MENFRIARSGPARPPRQAAGSLHYIQWLAPRAYPSEEVMLCGLYGNLPHISAQPVTASTGDSRAEP